MIAKQSVYLNLERDKALPDGHADAKFLLVRAGQEVAEADLERYDGAKGLADAEPEEKEVVPIPPPTLKDHGDDTSSSRQSIPQPKIKGDKGAPAENKKIAKTVLPIKKIKKSRAKKPPK